MPCCGCFDKFTRHDAPETLIEETDTQDKTSEEKFEAKPKPVRALPQRRSGPMWRLEQILMRQYTDKGEQLRLLEHAREIVKDTSQPITRQWNEQLLHNFVSVVPVGDEEEMANRGLIQALLDDGVDISMVDSSGDSPLLKAVKVGNRVAVDLLLRAQCDVNVKDRYGRTCLIYAAYMKDEETIKHLLQLRKSAIKMDLSDSTRYTALAYAASSGKIGICRLLLDAGANPNASSVSPLYLAVENNCSFELIELLVRSGSSVNACSDFSDVNVLMAAAKGGRQEVVTLLLKFDASFNKTWHRNQAFLSALQRDHVDVLTVFMEHGVSVESKTTKGRTILHETAAQGSVKFLSYLVSMQQLNLELPDKYGKTAFYLAAEQGHKACMEVLFDANVDCCAKDNKGQTPLEAALLHNQCDAVKCFTNKEKLVCPREILFSTLQRMSDVYDSEALGKIGAFVEFRSSLQDNWGGLGKVESMKDLCTMNICQSLGQRGRARATQLPLPGILKDLIKKGARSEQLSLHGS